MQLNNRVDTIAAVFQQQLFYKMGNKKLMVIDKPVQFEQVQQKIDVDIIIISKNPKLSIARLQSIFNCSQYIFDASNSLWKIAQWQKDCKALHLNFHSIPAEGAFVCDVGM